MKIVDLTVEYAAAAELLAKDNYREEREHVSCLPEVRELPGLQELAQNSLGVAAVEDDRLLGFWTYIGPWENEFGSTAQGIFTPVHAHGAIKENREDIYCRMYQTLAEKLVQREIAYHTIALYAHDSAAVSGLFTYGFGMRCMDAVRALEEIHMPGRADETIACRESGQTDFSEIRKLRACLGEHLGKSPCFIKMSDEDIESWQRRKESGSVRVFTAWKGEELVAYLEITDDGENFATEDAEMQNICGAYCVPAYRGQGIMQHLLNHVIRTLRAEGYTKLGVDYESINPTARGFWTKYFEPYTYSLTRRIVESAYKN
ncbi:MAG: GNAT family N-acetyltransferase [Lachnospiraceae bacterium]|nr:GNAT family N-acetyltransferase [Lachnospiraceae bacterium]